MLETVTQGFQAATERLRGVKELSEENIDEAMRGIRVSLLEADVELNVVKTFLSRVKQRALGEVVQIEVEKKGTSHNRTPILPPPLHQPVAEDRP